MKKPYSFRKSKIHGVGTFAAKDFKRGTILPVLFTLYSREYLNSKKFGGYNHSCKPNIKINAAKDYLDRGNLAIRNIKAGEELTVSYGSDHFLEGQCNCPLCRKRNKLKKVKQ